jgi:hypothetical protein
MVIIGAGSVEGPIKSDAGRDTLMKQTRNFALDIMPFGIFAYPGNGCPSRYDECAWPVFVTLQPNFV